MTPRSSPAAFALVAVLALSGCAGSPGAGGGPTGGGSETGGEASCAASPRMDLGPYFVDGKPHRSDVRANYPTAADVQREEAAHNATFEEAPHTDESGIEDPDEEFIDGMETAADIRTGQGGTMQEGVTLRLTVTVNEKGTGGACTPLAGARVDIWHSNAHGRYSGFAREGTTGESWLRGALETDGNGQATFTTIWPGWYPGRAVHIHVKVREGNLDFTSQFFFDPAVNAQVMQANAPYNTRPIPDTPNASDGIYNRGGANMILLTQEAGGTWNGSKAIVVQ